MGAESNIVCLQSLENLSETSPEYPGPHIAGHPAGLAAISGGEKRSLPYQCRLPASREICSGCLNPALTQHREVRIELLLLRFVERLDVLAHRFEHPLGRRGRRRRSVRANHDDFLHGRSLVTEQRSSEQRR